jgi:hypothetical protein
MSRDSRIKKQTEKEADILVGEYLRKHDKKQYDQLFDRAQSAKLKDDTMKAKAVKDLFKLGDRDQDGTISRSELEKLFATLGVSAEEEFDKLFKASMEFDKLFKASDTNNDGKLQYDEFVDWLFKAGDRASQDQKPHSERSVVDLAAEIEGRVKAEIQNGTMY